MRRVQALLGAVCLAIFAAGCATGGGNWRENSRTTCAIVGGVVGAGIGAAVSNPNHTDDNDQDMAVGAGVGGAAGAALGALLCGQKQAEAPRAAPAERPVPAPAPAPRRIVLRGVNFEFDSAQLRPDSEAILDEAADVLSQNSDVQVEVAGHTCNIGTDEYNQGLSERRSGSVVDYLVSKGIARSRLHPMGHGESQPVADNGTKDGRKQNRRTELNLR